MIRPEILCITLILKKIKKIFVVLSAALLLGTVSANAQSLKELFSNGGVKSVVESVVDQLDVIPKNIEGNWEFSGSAVKFTGDNVLMNAASELAAGKVEDQLNEYLQKVGIRQGLFSYVFNADKLLDFISKITSTVGDSKIGALASLIDQYDGLKIGFELSRVK